MPFVAFAQTTHAPLSIELEIKCEFNESCQEVATVQPICEKRRHRDSLR
jgi:hypothetical protein